MLLTERDLGEALQLWQGLARPGTSVKLVNYSENHTFRIERPGSLPLMLRVHRPNYQEPKTIDSELAWLRALHSDTGLPIPRPLAGKNGELRHSFLASDGSVRQAVLFHFLRGREPALDDQLVPVFGVLGGYAARMHLHAMTWEPPAGFSRQVWSGANILKADGLWGDWRIAPGVTDDMRTTLDELAHVLEERLAGYGTGADRYGLIHADMRLGNLLVAGDQLSVIDFDDCGFCWFGYDFAAAISFHETDARIPALRAAWIRGYRAHRDFGDEHVAMLDTMIMLRRMALLAWIGSHAETTLAQTHATGFAKGTAHLAKRYLHGALWG